MTVGGSQDVSTNEREFILQAAAAGVRVDGRRPLDLRECRVAFGAQDGAAEVTLGDSTRVLSVASAELVTPYPDRPRDGQLQINVELSPMADPSFEAGRPGQAAVELSRLVDRVLRLGRAVDMEALCVAAGRKVWSLRVDIHALDNGGNLTDCVMAAALAALMSFRRPEATLQGDRIIVYPPEVREPVPLNIHHLPVAISFAFVGEGNILLADPSLKEEAVAGARITWSANALGEICAVQKPGGTAVPQVEILRSARIATTKAQVLTEILQKAYAAYDAARQYARVRRKPAAGLQAVDVDITAAKPQMPASMADVASMQLDGGNNVVFDAQLQSSLAGGKRPMHLGPTFPREDVAMPSVSGEGNDDDRVDGDEAEVQQLVSEFHIASSGNDDESKLPGGAGGKKRKKQKRKPG
eukprot:jgi/Chlat1/4340/Chrsp29S04497